MKNCLRCWLHIEDNPKILWCKKCSELVNQEFRWEVSRPYYYYFKWHLKRIKHDRKLTEKLVNTVIGN